ncbi:MAG: hypothetical protein ACLQVY_10885 [Limisphaerales bacterium]
MTTEDNRRRLQRAALQEHLALVEQSADALHHSLAKCAQLEIKAEYMLTAFCFRNFCFRSAPSDF